MMNLKQSHNQIYSNQTFTLKAKVSRRVDYDSTINLYLLLHHDQSSLYSPKAKSKPKSASCRFQVIKFKLLHPQRSLELLKTSESSHDGRKGRGSMVYTWKESERSGREVEESPKKRRSGTKRL